MTRLLESAGRHCDSIMSEFSVICSLIHRPSRKAVFSLVPGRGTSALSAARAARRFAWPLRDREAFRRAGGCAGSFLRPFATDGSRGWELLLNSVRTGAGRRRNPRCTQFGLRPWYSGGSDKAFGRMVTLSCRPAGSFFAVSLVVAMPSGARMYGRRRAPRILAARSSIHTLP